MIQNRSQVGRCVGRQLPAADGGDSGVVGEDAVHVDADDSHALADVLRPRLALVALAAGYMGLHRYQVPLLEVGDLVAYLHHLAAHFVAEDHRRLDPGLGEGCPVVDVDVGAAYGGRLHLYQDIFRADGGDIHIHQLGSRSRLPLHYRFHLSAPPAAGAGDRERLYSIL